MLTGEIFIILKITNHVVISIHSYAGLKWKDPVDQKEIQNVEFEEKKVHHSQGFPEIGKITERPDLHWNKERAVPDERLHPVRLSTWEKKSSKEILAPKKEQQRKATKNIWRDQAPLLAGGFVPVVVPLEWWREHKVAVFVHD